MRRFALVLFACALALIPFSVQPMLAHASSACGVPSDADYQPYLDRYQVTSTGVTGADGRQHTLDLDLATYRMSVGIDCTYGFYVSTWFPNHEAGHQTPIVNAYTNYPNGFLRGPWIFDHGTFWDWGNFVITGAMANCQTCGTLGPWGSYTESVTLPNNQTWPMSFGLQYGPGRNANTANSHVTDCPEYCFFYAQSQGPPNAFWYLDAGA